MGLQLVWVCRERLCLGQVMAEAWACERVSGPGEDDAGRVKTAKPVIFSEFASECWKVFDLVVDFLLHRIERGCLTPRSLLVLAYRCHLNRSISSRIACIGG